MMKSRQPHFLEVFLPNFSSQRLKIPPKFIKHLVDRASGSLSLTGPSGNLWTVKLIEHDGDVFFDDGWTTFVKDHSLECGDSLVFRYDGNSHFTVQIFDQSSCEKEEAFYAKYSQEDVGRKRVRKKETAFMNVQAEKKTRGSWVHLDCPDGSDELKLDVYSNEGQKLKLAVEQNNLTSEFVKTSEKAIALAINSSGNGHPVPNLVNSCSKKKNPSKVKKACPKKLRTGACKKAGISKFIEKQASQYFTSDFPYFVRVMKYSNVSDTGTLKVPIHFSKAYLPNCRLKVTLQNINGDYWVLNSVSTTRLHSTLHTFCGGWLAFVRGNGLKMEDLCIFELLGDFEMRVRIVHLGLEGLDSQNKTASDIVGGLDLRTAGNVQQDMSEVHFPKNAEQTNRLCTSDSEQPKTVEMMAGTQEESTSTIHTCDEAIALKSPEISESCPVSRPELDDNRKDELPELNVDEALPCQTSRKQAYLQSRCTLKFPLTVEQAKAAVSFTSPFPNFTKVMMYSNVGGSYTLAVPRKFATAHLPRYKTDITLRNLRGICWNVTFSRCGPQTKLCGGWTSFVRENELKIGDICIFELVDDMVLQVNIFEAGRIQQECPADDAVNNN